MEHLVYVHDKGIYRVDNRDQREITEKCKVCGDRDKIYLSWEEGKQDEALEEFFINLYENSKNKQKILSSFSKEELISSTRIYYACFRDMIEDIYNSGVITKEYKRKIIKENKQAEKEQLKVVKGLNKQLVLEEKR